MLNEYSAEIANEANRRMDEAISTIPYAFLAAVALFFGQLIYADDAPVHVNVDNFLRAETASQIDRFLESYVGGKVNTWLR